MTLYYRIAFCNKIRNFVEYAPVCIAHNLLVRILE